MAMARLIRLLFDRRPGGTELLMLRQEHAEHLNGLGVLRHREAHTLTRRDRESAKLIVCKDKKGKPSPNQASV